MSLSATDQNELVLPLFAGLFEAPLWGTFLRRLLTRTGAQRVRLTLRNARAPGQPPLRLRAAVPGWEAPDEDEPFAAAALAALRPNRVYALEELRDPAQPEERGAIGDARLIRMTGSGELETWIVLLHEREAFSAADSALLTALGPAMAAAMATLATIGSLRRRAEMAEDALALLGIGQAALDGEGRVLVDDALAREELSLPLASAVPPAPPLPELARACADLAEAPPRARRALRLEAKGRELLLRPIPPSTRAAINPAVAIASFRLPAAPDPASAAQVVAASLGLSPREAALAEAMGRGQSIVEAGRALRLTPETARNYSKRIYAKTGASGQADLVRLVLSGLAPLA